MNFRSAKSRPKICNLGSEGREKAFRAVRSAGKAGSVGAQKSAEVCTEDLTRLKPRCKQTGAADPNAPSGASTAGPPFVGGRFGANEYVLKVRLLTFDVCGF